MLIDTHAHLDLKDFNEDRDEVIKRAFNSGVKKIINIGYNRRTSISSIKLAERYENIYAAVGVHPQDVKKYSIEEIRENLVKWNENRKVVAIGEIGLEYYRVEDEKNKEMQIKYFREQLDIAKQLQLPVVLHCRDAYEEMFEVLKKDKVDYGVVHCFSSNKNVAREFLSLGFNISYTGIVTFKKKVEDVVGAAYETPIDRIMIETDCPFLAPEPYRGKRNEPGYVKYIAEKLATIKEIGLDEVEKATTENAIKMFNLK